MNLEMVIQKVGLEDVAKVLNVNAPTLKEKVSHLDFTIGEMFELKSTLGLDDEQTCKLFCV